MHIQPNRKMDKNTLWSLRLGFSVKQSQTIQKIGLNAFLEKSFMTKVDKSIPNFLDNSPKSLAELQSRRKEIKNNTSDQTKELLKKEIQVSNEMKDWWLEKMMNDDFPLREKMTCFWHNQMGQGRILPCVHKGQGTMVSTPQKYL